MVASWLIERFTVEIRRLASSLSAAASVASDATAPFDFSGGDVDLELEVDGGAQTVTIAVAGMAAPSNATADEVAAAIIAGGLTGGTAYVTESGAVIVSTNTVEGGSIEITGGAANAILDFPETLAEDPYDDVFGGLRRVPGNTQEGQSARREHPLVTLPCQVDRGNWGQISLNAAGGQTVVELVLTLDRRNVVAAGLVRGDGTPMLKRGDRIVRIRNREGEIEEEFSVDDPVFVERVERSGHGLSLRRPRFNLFYLHCARPDKGPA